MPIKKENKPAPIIPIALALATLSENLEHALKSVEDDCKANMEIFLIK